jgi:hypothetical protein
VIGKCVAPIPVIFHGLCRSPVSKADPCCECPGFSSARNGATIPSTNPTDTNALRSMPELQVEGMPARLRGQEDPNWVFPPSC